MIELSFIADYLKLVNDYVFNIVGGNEFASGMLLTGLMGTAAYLSRSIPETIWYYVKKHTTTSIVFNSTHESFYWLSKHLQDNGLIKQSRVLKVSNGRDGDGEALKEIGYGTQIFWFNWYTPLLIDIEKESDASKKVKEFIKIKKFGRGHKFFDNLIKNIKRSKATPGYTKYYDWDYGDKTLMTTQPERTLESITLKSLEKNKLINAIDSFVTKEQWFLEKQIPYQLGILLYGPPGTGKTTLIKAIASYMQKDIVYTDKAVSLTNAAAIINDEIIVIEEIDTKVMAKRKQPFEIDDEETTIPKDLEKNIPREELISAQRIEFGNLLSSLDGLISNHGRVVVMTTNHIDFLDPALIRPGRIDVIVEVGYLDTETFNNFLVRFFPDHKHSDYIMCKEVSPVQIQNDIVQGKSLQEIISKYTKGVK